MYFENNQQEQNATTDYSAWSQSGYDFGSPVPPAEPRRKKGFMGKAVRFTAAALAFGVVAGGAMAGVQHFGTSYLRENYPLKVEESTAAAKLQTSSGGVTNTVQTPAAGGADVSGIVEKAMPSVVAIDSTTLYQANNWFYGHQQYEVPSSGSGIIVGQNDEELLIVTNNHVVQDTTALKVNFIDGTAVNAAVKGTDSESDLAVIAVRLAEIPQETLDQITIATMGDSDALKVGEGVIAIGNALGYGQSVTVGYVSALNREVKTAEGDEGRMLLQTDAAINPGNSGGALLNMQGEVIGINAAKYSSTEVEGMGYAIPISQAQDIINELMNKKTRVALAEDKQGYLGIQGTDSSSSYDMPSGVFIYKIVEGGAAAQSDLREKDIITKFDGQSLKGMTELQELLTYYEAGTTVDLTVQSLENGTYVERIVPVTLAGRPVNGVQR